MPSNVPALSIDAKVIMTVPASELLKPHDAKASRLRSVATPIVFTTRACNGFRE
jgi:hypothetical protein